jgi:hypothetical protein
MVGYILKNIFATKATLRSLKNVLKKAVDEAEKSTVYLNLYVFTRSQLFLINFFLDDPLSLLCFS